MRSTRAALVAVLAAVATTAATLGPAQAQTDPGDRVFVSELHYDNDGADAGEAVEVVAPSGTDLAGWSVALYNGTDSRRSVYDTVPLSGVVPDEAGGLGALAFERSGIQNGSPDGIALVDPAGEATQLLSYEGAFQAASGPAAGLGSTDIGVQEDAGTPAGQSLQLRGTGCTDGDLAWTGPAPSSLGSLGQVEGADCPAIPPGDGDGAGDGDGDGVTRIHDVQGAGAASPMTGADVVVEGVVVGAPGAGPAGTFDGYYLQEEDAQADADPATSEGVFVYAPGGDTPARGDTVRVSGRVAEYGGLTELTDATARPAEAVGDASPAAVMLPLEDRGELEAHEGMLVTFPQTLTLAEYFDYDRYGEVVAALPTFAREGQVRPMTPTAVFDPDDPRAAALADLNERSRITVDDGLGSQNPTTPVHPVNRELYGLENDFRGGEQVGGLTGPLHEAFGAYRILPLPDGAGYGTYRQRETPPEPEDVGGDLRIAGMNALNYFTTIDDGTPRCGPQREADCRGADDAGELERQRTKLLNALEGLDADVVGLNEVENTRGVEALADVVAGLNQRAGSRTWRYVRAGRRGVVGGDAIKVGLIYRRDVVHPVGRTAVLDDPSFTDPRGTGEGRNRAAVAHAFVQKGTGERLNVVVNHLKSKGSSCGPDDDGELTGSCNRTRTLAAQRLAEWIDSRPTRIRDEDWLVLGDLNSYDHEDPIATLEGAGYTDLVKRFQGEYAYSYDFDGQFGYLDHLLSSRSLTRQVTGATEWHINADTPDIEDYDTSFKSAYQAGLFDATTPDRASDHDAALLGLDLDRGRAGPHRWSSPPAVNRGRWAQSADRQPHRGLGVREDARVRTHHR